MKKKLRAVEKNPNAAIVAAASLMRAAFLASTSAVRRMQIHAAIPPSIAGRVAQYAATVVRTLASRTRTAFPASTSAAQRMPTHAAIPLSIAGRAERYAATVARTSVPPTSSAVPGSVAMTRASSAATTRDAALTAGYAAQEHVCCPALLRYCLCNGLKPSFKAALRAQNAQPSSDTVKISVSLRLHLLARALLLQRPRNLSRNQHCQA